MAQLSIRLLGLFQVTLDGEPLTGFASDKVRALLAYLAVASNRPHRREALAGLLWPDYPEASARATLRNALANLRRVIGDPDATPPYLEITRQTIQFNRHSDHWLDVTAFAAALEADTATHEELTDAVALYRGPFLEGFSLPDSAAFEEWLIATREHLGRQALGALRRLVEMNERSEDYEAALPFAWRQVELEPWQEEGHQQVMRLLARTGRRSEALAQYERCHQLLQDELDVAPATDTTALYDAIRSGELAPETTIPLTERAAQATYNLPAQPTPFVGREQELATLEALLDDPEVRLVSVLGPGGIGKTRLALAVGARVADAQGEASAEWLQHAFPHGVVFVPLAPLSSADGIVPAIADALQLRLEGGQDQLRDYLRPRQLLLILDNMDHLLEPTDPAQQRGADLLADLMAAAPGVKLLVTSRERLQLHGEHAFPIGGLALPDQDLDLSALAGADQDNLLHQVVEVYPAIKLFVLTAQRAQPHFTLDPDAATRIAQLCRLVEGMPLALELAASWTDTLPLDDILAAIRGSLDFLQTEWRDLPPRQRSMRAVFDASWARLGEAEQAVFPRLSVFRGGFTRTTAEQVAMPGMEPPASARLLSRLVAKSFLQVNLAVQRFHIHELLRQYAAEKLAQDPDHESEVRDRHSLHFCGWLQERDAGFMGAGHEAALADIGREIENARAACHWAAAQGEAKRLIQAVGALGRFHYCRGAQPGHVLFEGLAATLAVAHDPASPSADVAQRAMARILTWESTFSGMLGHAERRAHLAEEARVLLDTPPLANQDTRLERAYLYWQFGFVHRETDPKTARTFFRRSRDLFLELGDRWGQAQALMGLGMAARNLGAHHEAEEAVTQALELCQAVGDDQGATGALALLGDIAMEQSDFARAERFVRQGLNLASEQSRGQIAYGLFKLGGILVRSGQFAEAKRPATESTSLFTDLGMRRMLIWSLLLSGQVHRHLADYQAARVLAEEALSLEHELGVQRGTGVALGLLGALALAEGAYPEARKLCDESIAGWQQSGAYPRRLEGELACAGLAARGLGQRGEASRDLLAQLKSAVEHHLFVPLLCALAGIALLLADEGEAEHAVELYALAQTYPFVANSRWFEDVAGREMAAIAASLPPATVQAAQARGQAQDLWQTAADLLDELSGRLAAD